MKILDLGCKAGIVSDGIVSAGHEVIGLDIESQPNYPYEFIQADALTYPLDGFDAYWASMPCQGYSTATRDDSKWVDYSRGKQTPRLIDSIRFRLILTGKPYVIENVRGAKEYLINPFLLCGSMFGLPIARHRYFETNFPVNLPSHIQCKGIAKKYARENGIEYRDMSVTGKGRHAGCSERWKIIMGIKRDVITQSEIVEAIPPIYSKYITSQIPNKK